MSPRKLDGAQPCEQYQHQTLYSEVYGNEKEEVKLSLCLIKHQEIKMYKGVEVKLCAFLISSLDGCEWSVSCPSHFTPEYLMDRRVGVPQSWSGRPRQ
jgi:hypothetical protein